MSEIGCLAGKQDDRYRVLRMNTDKKGTKGHSDKVGEDIEGNR